MMPTSGPGGALSAAQLRQFERDGYPRVPGVPEPRTVLEPLLHEYAQVLDRLAHDLYQRGEIGATYAELEFGERLIRIYRETGRDFASHFDRSLGGDISPPGSPPDAPTFPASWPAAATIPPASCAIPRSGPALVRHPCPARGAARTAAAQPLARHRTCLRAVALRRLLPPRWTRSLTGAGSPPRRRTRRWQVSLTGTS